MMGADIEREIARVLAAADALFEDKIRAATTTLLTVGGPDAEPDLEVLDDEIARCRREWAAERARIPDVIRRGLAARETEGHPA